MRLFVVLILSLTFLSCGKQDTPPGPSVPFPLPSVSLHEAARTGNVGQIQAHIHYKTDINMVDERGYTALQYATARGYGNVVRLLTENGAKADTGKGTVADLLDVDRTITERLKAGGHNALSYSFLKKPVTVDDLGALTSRRPGAIREVLLGQARAMSTMTREDQAALMRALLDLLPSRESVRAIRIVLGYRPPMPIDTSDELAEGMLFDPRLNPGASHFAVWSLVARENPALQEFLNACQSRPDLYPLLIIARDLVMPEEATTQPGWVPYTGGSGF